MSFIIYNHVNGDPIHDFGSPMPEISISFTSRQLTLRHIELLPQVLFLAIGRIVPPHLLHPGEALMRQHERHEVSAPRQPHHHRPPVSGYLAAGDRRVGRPNRNAGACSKKETL